MASDTGFIDVALDEFLYQVRLPPPTRTAPEESAAESSPNDQPWTVLLTGSTGSLGTHLVATLQRLPPSRLRRVYCLNRSADARDRLSASLLALGYPPLDTTRFTFLHAGLSEPHLGLPPAPYAALLAETTLILHNAWPVNFVLPGPSFRPHLAGLRNLLHLAHAAAHAPPVLFVSSLGIAYSTQLRAPIAERVYGRAELLIADGYSQSKYVAERMLEAYARASGLRAAVLRVGQIAGPVLGRRGFAAGGGEGACWPAREWLPTLLRASARLGALPRTLGRNDAVDWIPVDVVAAVLVEVAGFVAAGGAARSAAAPLVFNIANPARVRFGELLPHFAAAVAARAVPCHEWVRLLEQEVQRGAARGRRTPGAKLVGFYEKVFAPGQEELTALTDNTVLASQTARALHPVNGRWVVRWLEQWGYGPAQEFRARL